MDLLKMDILNFVALIAIIFSLATVLCIIKIYRQKKEYEEFSGDYVVLHKKYKDAHKYIEHLNEQNNILQTQALTDHATGLWNRRYLDAILNKEKERMKRMESDSLTLLMADIDNYKKVNDLFGHKSGDLLAIEFANHLKRIFRSSDYIFRTGGDEYVILMRDADKKTIAATTQRLQREIKKIIIEGKGVGSVIDVSIGASSFDHNDPNKDMLHEADAEMYKQKRAQKAGA